MILCTRLHLFQRNGCRPRSRPRADNWVGTPPLARYLRKALYLVNAAPCSLEYLIRPKESVHWTPKMAPEFRSLNIAVIGGGLGGLSAAISLRRAGHKITIYERHSFAGEVGAGIRIPSKMALQMGSRR